MAHLLLSHSSSQHHSESTVLLANKIMLKSINKGSNIVISPLSFKAVLGFIALGCNGPTQQQILQFIMGTSTNNNNDNNNNYLQSLCNDVVYLTSPFESNNIGILPNLSSPELRFANAVYLHEDYSFKASFVEKAQVFFKAESRNINHGHKVDDILSQINSWATRVSKGLITQLLNQNSLTEKTLLLISNAIYFKGKWAKQFDMFSSQSKNFYLLTGGSVFTQFMTTREKSHLFAQFNSFKVLALPYHNGTNNNDPRQFSMYLFLPNQINGLLSLIQAFNNEPLFLTHYNLGLKKVNLTELWIPKFKFSFELEASEEFKEMGLDLPFKKGNRDFNEMMSNNKGGDNDTIHLCKVFHKACIEVDEVGTESVAFSACEFLPFAGGPSSAPAKQHFVADHPFFFMIREEITKTVFFCGSVVNPLMT